MRKQVSPNTQSVMRQIFDFVKTTAFGGAIFLLPFAAALLVVVKAGKMAVDSVTPLAEKLPFPKGEAVIAIYVVGALLLALVAFAAGLFARSLSIKKDAASFLEDKVLNKLPPYVALRKYTDRLAGLEAKTNEDLKPALVRMHNGWHFGSLPTRSTMAKLPCLCPARLTLRREWCRLSAPTTSPLSLFLTETHSRALSSLGAAFQSSWQAPPLKSRIDWKSPQPGSR